MVEYYTKAIVLDKDPIREADCRVHLFTEQLGRVEAYATSMRKVTSKLASHFEPNNLVLARMTEKKQLRLIDGLKTDKLNLSLPVLSILRYMAPTFFSDKELFNKLLVEPISVEGLLAHFGFDPKYATCFISGESEPEYFVLSNHEFVSRIHLPSLKLASDEVIYLGKV